jgi:hypothetical protein
MRAGIELDHARRVRRVDIIEQQEVQPARLSREHTEVDALGEDGGAEREAATHVYRPLRGAGFCEFGRCSLKASVRHHRHVAQPEELFIAHVLCWH